MVNPIVFKSTNKVFRILSTFEFDLFYTIS